MAKVSIIVPIYNVEQYLVECMESIVHQTLKDIEIICVNDGSTDNSLKIIQDYAQKDNRIVIIDKQNEGYGKGMNDGLDKATGEYVGIVEPDDYVDLHMYEDLYKIAHENDLDVIKADFYRFVYKNGTLIATYNQLSKDGTGYNQIVNPKEHPQVFRYILNTWSGIYKREMLEKYHIDVVIYDIAGDTPCTGYILPVREGIMDKVILVTNDRYASVSTVNCLLSAVLRQGEGHPLVYLLENHTDCMSESELLDAYAAETHMTVLGCIEYNEVTEHAALMDETVVCEYPESGQAKIFRELAQKIVDVNTCSEPEPFSRTELLEWQQQWKMKRLEKLKRMK